MKIALVNTMAPFIRGGAEIAVDDLRQQLLERGHQVTLFRLPFPDNYEMPLMETILASKLLDFTGYDRVIAFKFPAYCICHPKKILWMFHQFRQVYELFGHEDGIVDSARERSLQALITQLDTQEIGSAFRVFVNAEEVAKRLDHFNGLSSEVMTPPLLNHEQYYLGEQGNYLYYPSRVTSLKRQHLAIEAMQYVSSDVKLYIAGRCTEADYERKLRGLIRSLHLESRVVYENRWVEDEEKIRMIANSLALLYIPYKEDSCGFVTVEAFYASKPVLSCTDSGGTYEFIQDGVHGYFAEPTPQALAEKIDLLSKEHSKTAEMGQNARQEILARNITWDETVRRLLT